MSYDIGIGTCAEISDGQVEIRLDSAALSRLVPNQNWRRSGTSVLRLPAKLCSQKRPPAVGEEVYLQHQALQRSQKGSLDIDGDGSFSAVELSNLVKNLDPSATAPVAVKARGKR
ncbi:hypothetical protein [Pseudoxanthomonas dokdonensis]|uniref:Uncharacterized protein n=1 Tax=Pseudoxanthomonas dokdonensis TaxID=344882 RepID=A0A0R0CWA1_9GAMM|nr:hypothetical protein [Pseudoxanthomonas dokdonensis]KRG70407.1 hypothetical protein ABB29_06535 [Pseudoxanthomonas dokdonensis]